MDRQAFQAWLDGYVEAWKTYDPDKIGRLFSDDAEYHPLAIDGNTHVANGWSRYYDTPGGEMSDEYLNVYVCTFNNAGECTSFTEYWIQNRDMQRKRYDEMKRKAVEDAANAGQAA